MITLIDWLLLPESHFRLDLRNCIWFNSSRSEEGQRPSKSGEIYKFVMRGLLRVVKSRSAYIFSEGVCTVAKQQNQIATTDSCVLLCFCFFIDRSLWCEHLCADMFNHRLWKSYRTNFWCKSGTQAKTATPDLTSGWKSIPKEIYNWNSKWTPTWNSARTTKAKESMTNGIVYW